MDREGAETYLRLLGEAQLREMLPPAPDAPAQGPGRGRARMTVVSQALTAVGALDTGAAADILAEFDLAMAVRELRRQGGQGAGMPPGAGTGTVPAAAVARVALRAQPGRVAPPPWPGVPPGSWLSGSGPRAAGPRGAGPQGPGTGGAEPREREPADGGTEMCVPVGLTVPFRDEGVDGELYLLAFARSGTGARLITLWGRRTMALERQLGLQHPELLPLRLFTVTDDRGTRYELDFGPSAGPEWASEISLRPDPPGDIRWLDVMAPPGPAVRVGLDPAAGPPGCPAEVVTTALSPGEQLLTMLAEQLLIVTLQFHQNLQSGQHRQGGLPAVAPRPVQAMAAGLGDMVAALEAADVLSPRSPVPARLAALCAGLGVDGHGLAAQTGTLPAPGLPEPWLSLLTHYQRRRPDPVPVHDGYAAAAAVLPELDGIRVAVCGLHNTQHCTVLHLLARGVTADAYPGPLGVNMDFPLSVWLRDGGGRWHASHLVGRHQVGREYALGLQVVPPLPLTTPWVDLLAAGRSAEVRVRLPVLGWHPW